MTNEPREQSRVYLTTCWVEIGGRERVGATQSKSDDKCSIKTAGLKEYRKELNSKKTPGGNR